MRSLTLSIGLILLTIASIAQTVRYGSGEVNGVRYLIAQQELHQLTALDELIYLTADDGVLSVAWQNHANAAYLRHYSEWGVPYHAPTRVDDESPPYDDWRMCGTYRFERSCVFWNNDSVFCGAWNFAGEELVSPFPNEPSCCPQSAAIAMDRFAYAESFLVSGSNVDMFVHSFLLDGTGLGQPIAFTETAKREQSPAIAFLSNDTLIAGYIRSGLTPESRPRIVARRIESDLSVGDFVELYPLNVQTKLVVRALPNDDFLAISDRFPAGDGGVAVRCDAHCTPIGDPIPLHAGWRGAAANARAEIALGLELQSVDWYLRLYEPDGTPVGGEWRPVIPPVSGILQFTWPQPIAFDDNGTIWVAWYQNGGFSRPIITMLKPYVPGDMNHDGLVNNFDIDPFVFALSNLPAYAATYNIPEDAAVIIGDINEDGFLNNFDIDPFVMLLAGE